VVKNRKNIEKLKELINIQFSELQTKAMKQFWKEFLPKIEYHATRTSPFSTSPLSVTEETYHYILAKASSYYLCTMEDYIENPSYNFCSFPWISVGKILAQILKEKKTTENK